MRGSRRLLTWLGAGAIIVAGAPAAYASPSAQPRSALPCGGSPGDFDGGFREVQYPEVGFLFDTTNEGTVTEFYRGAAIDQGTAEATAGTITWTLSGGTYTSSMVDCGDPNQPTRVTVIVANSADGTDQISLTR